MTRARFVRLATARWRVALALIAGAAVLVRVIAVVATADQYTPANDSADFDRIAVAVAATGEQPDTIVPGGGPGAFRPPALPYLLGATYAVVGHEDDKRRWTAARLVQAVLGGLVAGAAGLVALLVAGPLAALIAASLVAVDPTLGMLSLSLLTEPLFMLLALLAAAAVLAYRRDRRLLWAVSAGVAAGGATLTRSNGMIVAGLVALAAVMGWRRWTDLRGGVVVLATAALVVMPWTVRNAVVLDAFIPVSTASGYTAAGLYNEAARRRRAQWQVPVEAMQEFRRRHPTGGDVEFSEALEAHARRFIRENPGYLAEVGFWNLLRVIGLYQPGADRGLQEGEGINRTAAAAGVYCAWLFVPLIVVGLASGGARLLPPFLWAIALLLAVSAIFLGGGNARYRAPVEAILIVGAAAGLATRCTRAHGPRSAPA